LTFSLSSVTINNKRSILNYCQGYVGNVLCPGKWAGTRLHQNKGGYFKMKNQFHSTNFLLVAVALSLLIFSSNVQADWEKTFGGAYDDGGRFVRQAEDGGYIIAGSTVSFGAGGYDVYLVKTDALGNMQWQKTFGGAWNDGGYCVQQTTDGGYIIAGQTQSVGAGEYDVYLIKTDALGDQQWQKTFGGANRDIGCFLPYFILYEKQACQFIFCFPLLGEGNSIIFGSIIKESKKMARGRGARRQGG
jgi:hypothetical protein